MSGEGSSFDPSYATNSHNSLRDHDRGGLLPLDFAQVTLSDQRARHPADQLRLASTRCASRSVSLVLFFRSREPRSFAEMCSLTVIGS